MFGFGGSGAPRRRGRLGALIMVFGLGLATAACSSGDSGDGVIGGARDTVRSLYGFLLGSVSSTTGLGGAPQTESLGGFTLRCPELEVRSGASHHISYAPGEPPSPRTVRYQGTITQTARDCDFRQDSVVFRFGFAGRVLLGPRGQPAGVEMPVRVLLAWQDDEVAWTRLYKIPVTIQPGETSGFFVHVEENFDFVVPVGTQLSEYRLYIGFDSDDRAQAVPVSQRGGGRFQ